MNPEADHPISESAIHWREGLAFSSFSESVFPVDFTDPFNAMGQLCRHLEYGGSSVIVFTHPTMEDIFRVGRFFNQWKSIRERRIGIPAAIHQKLIVNLVTKPFDIDKAWLVTEHTKDRVLTEGLPVPRKFRQRIAEGLRQYNELINNTLTYNGTLAVAATADQAAKLTPPEKPGVVDHIMRRIKRSGLSNILFVPIGIEIPGIRDYDQARNVTLARYPYTIHVGKTFMDYEIETAIMDEQMTPDYFVYVRLRPLVTPEYLSE
ncbi:MAG TPA: hypothetical protein VMR81_01165 [Patescibacteria group bacterium]|nr:hypothetical protein [Patescibacteria group bacterium]